MNRTAVARRRMKAIVASVSLIAASISVLAISIQPSSAATTYNVTSGADSGGGSLRAAITQADTDDVDAVIEIDAGLAISLTGAELDFSPATATRTLTINGNGATLTRTAGTGRFLNDASTGALAINELTLTGFGLTINSVQGGVIRAEGPVALTDVAVTSTTNIPAASGMFAGSVTGGVVYAGGAISLVGTTVANTTNDAQAGTTFAGSVTAGLFFNSAGLITLNGAALTNTRNTARALTGFGGSVTAGIAFSNGSGITIIGSSIDGTTNTAETSPSLAGYIAGGLLFTRNPVIISGSTITDTSNDAQADPGNQGFGGGVSGGVAFHNANLTVTNSTISGIQNSAEGGGIFGANIVGGAFFTQDGDGTYTNTLIEQITNTTTVSIGTGSHVSGGAVFGQDSFSGRGRVTLVDSVFTDITSTAASGASLSQPEGGVTGGAIYAQNDVTLTRSTVANADATTAGAASSAQGGGIYAAGGEARLTNSTVTNNSATSPNDSRGGGIYTLVPLTLVYSDVVGNAATHGANLASPVEIAVPANAGATVATFGSVIAKPGGGGTNCSDLGVVTSSGYNVADDTSCGFLQVTDRQTVGFDPKLGGLAENGGPTPTLLPQLGSPLIDAIPAAACRIGPLATAITTDQRGFARPEVVAGACDIGAVEVQPIPPPPALIPTFTG